MSIVAVAAAVAGWAASAVLVCAGVAKHTAPEPAARALAGLVPTLEPVARPLVRAIATIELLTALGLLIPAVRPVAAAVLAALGVGFAAVGVAGNRAADRTPCGCFGSATGRPFGPHNVVAGVALLAVTALVPAAPAGSPAVGTTVTAALTVVLCGWLHRGRIVDAVTGLRAPVRPAGTRGEGR